MPTVLIVGSFRFFFFSNEGGEPVHVHVESGEKYAKYWLEPIRVAKSVGFSARELNKLRQLVLENQAIFKEKWDGYFSGKTI